MYFFTEFKVDINPKNDVAKLIINYLFLKVWRPPVFKKGNCNVKPENCLCCVFTMKQKKNDEK